MHGDALPQSPKWHSPVQPIHPSPGPAHLTPSSPVVGQRTPAAGADDQGHTLPSTSLVGVDREMGGIACFFPPPNMMSCAFGSPYREENDVLIFPAHETTV